MPVISPAADLASRSASASALLAWSEASMATRIRLSGAGEDIYRAVEPLALTFEEDLLASLSPAEQRALDKLLEKLLARAGDLDAPSGQIRPASGEDGSA